MTIDRIATLTHAAALIAMLDIVSCSSSSHPGPTSDSGGTAGPSDQGSGGNRSQSVAPGVGDSGGATGGISEAGSSVLATAGAAGQGTGSQASSSNSDAGASDSTLACSVLVATDACDKCSNNQCCTELSACVADTTCSSAADTWDSCWAGADATTACDTAFANTGYLARAWLGCLSAKCGPECDSPDAGVGCKPDDATDPCDVCSSANCCLESTTCLLSTDCSKANDQWDTCSQSTNGSTTCDTQFAASGPEAKAWYTCLTKSCATQCGL